MDDVAVIGSLNYDISVSTAKIPEVGETVIGRSIAYHCGGKGANQACACAKAGARTFMFGAVGNDASGEILEASLKSANVLTQNLLKVQNVSSGNAIVTVDDNGDNSIIVIPGANHHILPQHIYDAHERLRSVNAVLLQFEIPIDTIYAAIETAKREGCIVILNPAPVQKIQEKYLAMIDYLIPNEKELHQLVSGNGSIEEKALSLISSGIKNIIITLGKNGVLYVDSQNNIRHYPARKVDAIDTVGAGDCFCGYFTAAVAKGEKVEKAIQEAIVASSISVTRIGAQEAIPAREEVIRITEEEK